MKTSTTRKVDIVVPDWKPDSDEGLSKPIDANLRDCFSERFFDVAPKR
jgi:hypothetical protein